jgi:ABC-type multidrug transport system fused ATPase/permease subunit
VINFLALTDRAEPVTEPAPAGPAPLVDTVTGVRVDPGSFTAVVTARQAHARGIVDRLAGLEPGGLWNGAPTTATAAGEVRARILVADDDAALFAGSLSANVAGRSAASERGNIAEQIPSATVRDALKVASADDVVDGLTGGWDGLVTSGGTNLSGGQRQRVRLARAIAADPEVLLAVDPTSALDAHTEATVATRLQSARRGRTTVVTTTSPLVLERASHVHFVVNNQVVASGTHQQLLGDQRYCDLVVRGDAEQAS